MENYLSHHGVKGQRWGVRRYQNKDGSLTEAGRKHYGVAQKQKVSIKDQLADESLKVVSSASINYAPIIKEPINKTEVARRGGLTKNETKECIKLANGVYAKAAKEERRITPIIVEAVADNGASMHGLEHRLKQPTSIAAKIGSDAKKDGISFSSAAGSISDSIRYTVLQNDDKFVKTYASLRDNLADRGFSEIKCKNYFSQFRDGKVSHKALQSIFETPNGVQFEVQFQTPYSQAAKNLKLPLYNEVRRSDTTLQRRDEIIGVMKELAENTPNPSGIFGIKEITRSSSIAHSSLMHHGVKGQKWGVRRYRNKDGSLTEEGVYHYRKMKANKTKGDVDRIYNSMSRKDKALLGDSEGAKEFLTSDEGEYVVKRFLDKDGDVPVAFLDIMTTAKVGHLTVAVGTDPKYRGQGRALKLAQKGVKWFDKNADKLGATYLGWGAYSNNTPSRKIAEKAGFAYEPNRSSDEWSVYGYQKK